MPTIAPSPTPIQDRDPRWQDIRETRLSTEAGDLRTFVHDGPADGTPHLLVHGLGVSAATWLDVMPELARSGRVVAIDLPGFGGSPLAQDADADIGTLTAAIEAARDALGMDRVVLHGNSLGGQLALRHAASHPDTVEQLVLVAPALPTGPRHLLSITPATVVGIAPLALPVLGEAAMWAAARSGGPFPGAEMVAGAVFADPGSLRSSVQELFAEESAGVATDAWRRRAMLQATRATVPTVAAWWRVERLVRDLDVPTSVVWGQADRLLSRRILDRLRDLRPDWRYTVLEDAGHSPMMERPDAYAEAVLG